MGMHINVRYVLSNVRIHKCVLTTGDGHFKVDCLRIRCTAFVVRAAILLFRYFHSFHFILLCVHHFPLAGLVFHSGIAVSFENLNI